jgi:hypothetical protein
MLLAVVSKQFITGEVGIRFPSALKKIEKFPLNQKLQGSPNNPMLYDALNFKFLSTISNKHRFLKIRKINNKLFQQTYMKNIM